MVSRKCTGTYCFIIEFYGLTDIPAAFQKVMYNTLVGLKNTHCFLEHINIVSKGSKHDHLKSGEKSLEKLDEDNLRINLPKCHFARTEIEWLAYKFSQSAISPVESKISISNSSNTKNTKTITFLRKIGKLFRKIYT